jgi:hypothetical protein
MSKRALANRNYGSRRIYSSPTDEVTINGQWSHYRTNKQRFGTRFSGLSHILELSIEELLGCTLNRAAPV